MNTVTLDEVRRRIHKLPSLPKVVMELLASLDRDDVNIDALVKKIAKDQALAAKTLRLANSSFYGMARQVATIQDAVIILGFRTVRSLATTAALMGALTANAPGHFNAVPFWRHSIAVAICARELTSHLPLNPEQAYTAGLLHDIGRLALVTQFPSHYEATLAYRDEHDCNLLEAEQVMLGLDHAAVGQALTQHWQFPEELQQAVAGHHAPLVGGKQTLSLVVRAADVIAHALDLSRHWDDLVPPVPVGLWQRLGLDEKTLLSVFENTEKQFASASLVVDA